MRTVGTATRWLAGRLTGGRLAGGLAAAALLCAAVLALVVAPPDAVQGQAQRLMYLHVPAAWTAYCAYAVVLACSATYLLRPVRRIDACAQAAAEVGVTMTALTIGAGSLWGHFVWGVWWTWDARLVSTAVLLLIYLGYLGVRGLSRNAVADRRRAAVVGVVGFAQVPVVHFSVLWWRTLHQPPTVLAPSASPPIDPRMLAALLVSMLAFMLLGWAAFGWRLRKLTASALPAQPAAAPATDRTVGATTVAQPPAVEPVAIEAEHRLGLGNNRSLAGAQGEQQ